jgi:hypothetical protein
MSFVKEFEEFLDNPLDYLTSDSVSQDIMTFLSLANVLGIEGIGDSTKPMGLGYTGELPRYSAVRDQIEYDDTDRRPGSAGRRYFTDTIYAKNPLAYGEGLPSLEGAMQQVAAQKADYESAQTKLPDLESEADNQYKANRAEGEAKQQGTGQTELKSSEKQKGLPSIPTYEEDKEAAAKALQYNPEGMSAGGRYLDGMTDGMADQIPAKLDDGGKAYLSDGEFVIPADVVSHLGNGSSNAGAKKLHNMMDNVRMARTGTEEQGKEINPNKFMPKMNEGGILNTSYSDLLYKSGQELDTGTPANKEDKPPPPTPPDSTDPDTGTNTDAEIVGDYNTLSPLFGDYVVDTLAKGKALSEQPYEAYTGPLTAGESDLQEQAFEGIGGLDANVSGTGAYTPEAFTGETVGRYMNPYLENVLDPRRDELRRQAEIDRIETAGRLTRAGGFGGSRQAIMEAEGLRNLATGLDRITGEGYATAYDKALDAFYDQQDLGRQAQQDANRFAFDVLDAQTAAGAIERGIEAEGIAADKAQFEEERDYPLIMQQYAKSLLEGLPLATQEQVVSSPGGLTNFSSIIDYLRALED